MKPVEKCPVCGAAVPKAGGCVSCLLRIGLDPGPDPALAGSELVNQDERTAREAPTTVIGRYKLLRQIGEGAFGVVYLAEQEEPVRRQVALKILRREVVTREVLARFEAEWRALSIMDHTCIAEVLDAGQTEDGRPFFVMELVKGLPITVHCDQHRLSIRQRLELFIQVCQAVQHAHQKGVIHRDLKPSNILISEKDGKPAPKVIDFGVAKAALGYRSFLETQTTALQQVVGTPAYMSPEQAGVGGLDVDVRSDIYSLGVLLYELLTAEPAFSQADFCKVADEEMLRLIRERDPLRPSTRLANLKHQDLQTVAEKRQIIAGDLAKAVKGDLDWIVMRALEKDRDRRYATADGLAMDVRRYLDNEPVLAGPPSRLYRFRKLVRRNRVVFAASAAVATALILALVVSWAMFLRQRAEASRSAEMAHFLEDMLRSINPSVARGKDTQLLRAVLDKTTMRIDRDLKDQPEIEADLRSVLGSVYLSIGDYTKAETMYAKALDIRTNLFGPQHIKVADSLNDVAKALFRQGKYAQSEALENRCLAMRKRLLGDKDPKVAESLNNLANDLWFEGKLPEAEQMHRQALAMRKSLSGGVNPDVLESMDNLAGVLSAEDKLSEAEALQREAVKLNKQLLGDEHPDVAFSLNNLGDTLRVEGKFEEAESIDQQALSMRVRLLGENHPDVAASLFSIGALLWNEGKLPEAEATNRLSLAIRRKAFGNDNIDVAGSLNNLAGVLIDEHKLVEAEECQREAIAIQKRTIGPDHQDIAGSLNNLSAILQSEGKLAEALAMQEEVLAMRKRLFGEDNLDVASSYFNMAFLLELHGDLPGAERNARRSLVILKKHLSPDHPLIASSLAVLSDVLKNEDRLGEAEGLQREELTIRRSQFTRETTHPPTSPIALADCFGRLAETLLQGQKFADAEATAREFDAFCGKELRESWQVFYAESLLGGALLGLNKLSEAEPLLLGGYDGLKRSETKMAPEEKPRVKDAVSRIVRYYEATSQPEKVSSWKKEFESHAD